MIVLQASASSVAPHPSGAFLVRLKRAIAQKKRIVQVMTSQYSHYAMSGRKSRNSQPATTTTNLVRPMCTLATEGIRHGCGHYVVTREVGKVDCNTKYCINSRLHMRNCPHCPHCLRYFGPDHEQTIVKDTKAYCNECEYWYKGPGSRPRK